MHLPPRREGGRLLGRHARRRRPPLAGGHALAVVLHLEGRRRDADAHVRRPRPDRLRRPGARVLARVRARGQERDHAAPPPVPRGGPLPDPPDGRPRAPHARLGLHGRGARRRGSVSRAGPRPRLSRPHVRLADRRADPARHGQAVQRAARVGDRAAARPRRALHRAARGADAAPRAAHPLRAHERRWHRDDGGAALGARDQSRAAPGRSADRSRRSSATR